MSTTTSNMNLLIPSAGDTDYPTSASSTITSVDSHDHTSGKGVQIPTGGIADAAITTVKIGANAVTTAKILDANVTKAKLAALGQQVSSSDSGSFTDTSGSDVDVTNLTVTITTTGRPVFIGIIGNNNAGGSYVSAIATNAFPVPHPSAHIKFLRDASVITTHLLESIVSGAAGSNLSITVPPTSFFHIEVPAAGTYTYKVKANSGTGSIFVNECNLIAYEL
jgi:hypothetical protein